MTRHHSSPTPSTGTGRRARAQGLARLAATATLLALAACSASESSVNAEKPTPVRVGAATRGPDPVEAARLAAKRGVRVFTVGLGTPEGAVVQQDGVSMRIPLDEERLRKVADVTRARFFRAADADGLRAIYRDVSARLVMERRETEVGAPLVALAVLLTLAAATVAYRAASPDGSTLIDEKMLNTVVVLVIASSILGPVLTRRFGVRVSEHSRRRAE